LSATFTSTIGVKPSVLQVHLRFTDLSETQTVERRGGGP
jgi:hypothetical protein